MSIKEPVSRSAQVILDTDSPISSMAVHSYEIEQSSGVIVIGTKNISIAVVKLLVRVLRTSS